MFVIIICAYANIVESKLFEAVWAKPKSDNRHFTVLATTRAHYTIFSDNQLKPNLINEVRSQPKTGLDQNYSTS